jgi:hypothetical protein
LARIAGRWSAPASGESDAFNRSVVVNERSWLTWISVLGVFLFIVHWSQDVALGIDRVGLQSYGGVAICLAWLLSATILREYGWGRVLLVLFSGLAAAMPALHLKGTRIAEIARGDGGLAYLVVMFTLAVAAALATVLAMRELVRLRRG